MPETEDIRVSAEVAAVLGVRPRPTGGRYVCWRCGLPGDTTAPTSAIVVAGDTYPSLYWAHAECVPSMVVQSRGRHLIGANGDIPDSLVRMRAAVLPDGPGRLDWPVLLHEFEPVSPRDFAGPLPGRMSIPMSVLLQDGLAPVDGRLLAGLGPVAGWRLELYGARARLTAPDGTEYYVGRWDAPGGWERLAGERGGCLLVTGRVGLYERRGMSMPDRRLARALEKGALAGFVAGGVVPVARGRTASE